MVFTSFITRLYRGLIEGRKRQVEREMALYRHLLPRDLEERGDKLDRRSEDALPFGR